MTTKYESDRLKKLEEELENKKNAIKSEKNRIKREVEKTRKERLFLHGANLEAIFGEADPKDMMALVFSMIKTLKEKGVNDFSDNDFKRKIMMLNDLDKSHQAQIGLMKDLNREVHRNEAIIEFYNQKLEGEDFERKKFRVIRKNIKDTETKRNIEKHSEM
ncbi:MAG: hypothetical protein H9W81_14995 [Enterococcus sp.]|nr:hypothetical protein [Enterococcus sp.]